MLNQYSRLEFIMGAEALKTLRGKRVAVFGVGGVGGNVIEALARSGVGTIDVIDDDKVCLTNLNRQVIATRKTVGKFKVDAAEERIHDIDPDIQVVKHQMFYLPKKEDKKGSAKDRAELAAETATAGTLKAANGTGADQTTGTAAGTDPALIEALKISEDAKESKQEEVEVLDFTQWDYVVDAIDTVTGKIGIILEAQRVGVPVISCMGCGNRMDPTQLTVCDIYETQVDPLARVMRYELRKRGVKKLKVVYSTEPAIRPMDVDNSCLHHCICPPGSTRKCTERRDIPGSSAFVPPVAGMIAASVIVRDLTNFDPGDRIKGNAKNPRSQKKQKAKKSFCSQK